MRLVWTPEGSDAREWELSSEDLSVGEVCDLEDATGKSFMEVADGLRRGSMSSMMGLLWVVRRRDEPGLAFEDLRAVRVSDLRVAGDDGDEAPKG